MDEASTTFQQELFALCACLGVWQAADSDESRATAAAILAENVEVFVEWVHEAPKRIDPTGQRWLLIRL